MSQMPKWQNLFVVNLPYPELCDSPLLWLRPVWHRVYDQISFTLKWSRLTGSHWPVWKDPWMSTNPRSQLWLWVSTNVTCGRLWTVGVSRADMTVYGEIKMVNSYYGCFNLYDRDVWRIQWWCMWWKSSSGCDDDFKSTCTQCSYCSVMLTTAGGWGLHL